MNVCEECGQSIQKHWLSGYRAYCDPRGTTGRRQGTFNARQVNDMNRALGNKVTEAALAKERRENINAAR